MKKYSRLSLALILLLALTPVAAAPGAAVLTPVKDETVYVKLHADGSPQHIYLVNRLETPEAGVYADYGNYTSIANLSGSEQPTIDGDEIRWQSAAEVLYYEGQLEQGELPFTFSFTYKRDSTEVEAGKVVGQKGAFALTILVEPNPLAKAYFQNNYVAQIQVPIDLESVSDLRAPGATSVVAGKTATLAYTVLPKQSAQFVLQFNTDSFEMDSISISCIPFDSSSLLDFDTEEIQTGFSRLGDGFDQLISGGNELRRGLIDINDALARLSDGAGELATGTAALAKNAPELVNGAQRLQQGASGLDDGLGQLSPGASQLATGAAQLATGVGAYVQGAAEMAQGSQELSGGLAQLDSEGAVLTGGYAQLVGGLQGALSELPAQLIQLLGLNPQQQQTLGQVFAGMGNELNPKLEEFGQGLQNYTAAVGGLAQGADRLAGGLQGFAAQGQGLATGADELSAGAAGLSQGLGSLKQGSGQLAAGLGAFAAESEGLSAGTQRLSDGASSLAQGLKGMASGSKRLPSDVQALIEGQSSMRDGFNSAAGLLTDLDLPEGGEQPVSFVSEKISPRSVQFIASTSALKVETKVQPVPEEPAKSNGFFARLLRLFGLGK